MGPESEKDQIPQLDITLIDDEYIDFSGSPIKIIETPGHTLGHIIFFFEREKILFAGDTLFLMGCGRVFEGTHEQMFESLKKIRNLPTRFSKANLNIMTSNRTGTARTEPKRTEPYKNRLWSEPNRTEPPPTCCHEPNRTEPGKRGHLRNSFGHF